MNNSLYKRIEIAANVAIIAVALLFGFVLVKRFILSRSGPEPAAAFNSIKPPGAKISLPETNWSQNERHVVLVLQTGCHFCTESAPFYRRLAQAVDKRKDIELIAALPQNR